MTVVLLACSGLDSYEVCAVVVFIGQSAAITNTLTQRVLMVLLIEAFAHGEGRTG